MDLKAICLQNMVNQIKQLPPLLQEEVIGHSLKTIKEQAKQEAKKELLAELKRDSELVVGDLTDVIVSSRRTGRSWVRPEYTEDIDNDIYHNFVHISEMIVDKYSPEIIFNNSGTGYSDFEEESDY
jgi:hypothetical protein